MNKIAIYAGFVAVLASPFAALPAAAQSVNSDSGIVTLTGKVSCSRFGTGSVTARKGMSVAQTIQYCVGRSDYTLVSKNKIYRITGDRNLFAKMSGQTVTVAGHLTPEKPEGDAYALMGTVEATSVAPLKN